MIRNERLDRGERLNVGELETLLAALRAVPFEARRENHYLLLNRLQAWLLLLS